MILALLLGAVFGIGALVAASAFGVAEPLERVWARDERNADAAAWLSLDNPTPLGIAGSLIARLMSAEPVAGILDGSPFDQDLAVVGQDRVDFAAHVLVKAAITLGVGGFVAVFKPADSVATSRVVGVTILAALLMVLLSVQTIQNQAKRRRVEILEAVTAFVEFTRLASHTQSVEGAIRASARYGRQLAISTTRDHHRAGRVASSAALAGHHCARSPVRHARTDRARRSPRKRGYRGYSGPSHAGRQGDFLASTHDRNRDRPGNVGHPATQRSPRLARGRSRRRAARPGHVGLLNKPLPFSNKENRP